MTTEIIESDFSNPPPIQPVKSEQNQTFLNDLDRMCSIIAWQEVDNHNIFSGNLANLLNNLFG